MRGRMAKEDKEKLMKQAIDMVLSGFSYTEISAELKVNKNTVSNWVKSLREQKIKEIEDKAENIIAEMELSKQKRVSALWEIVLNPGTADGDKTRALKQLADEDMHTLKRLQLIGFVPADAPLVAIQTNQQNNYYGDKELSVEELKDLLEVKN